MARLLRTFLSIGFAFATSLAGASYHTFQIDEIFSNADGTVQYVVLHEALGMDGQNALTGHALTNTGANGTGTFVFPHDLPGPPCGYYGCTPSPTANRRVLIATQGFVALGLMTSNYTMPNGFLSTGGGTLSYAGVDQWTYGSLPTDGVNALFRSGTVQTNLATNFNGTAISLSLATPLNYQGLWWNPAESGWGVNFAHQGDQIFATWYTYDSTGKAWWLSMLAARTTSTSNVYAGTIFADSGPPFNNFVGAGTPAPVGSGTVTFADAGNGTFDYTVNGVSQSKAITRYDLGTGPQPTCVYSLTTPNFAAATNFQDLWWVPAGAETGWGVNFAHQGNSVFATWYTYNVDHSPLWLSALLQQGMGSVYAGPIYQNSGPRFDAYDTTKVVTNPVGTATVTFADGNNATFGYTVMVAPLPGPVTQAKSLTRFPFAASGGTVCH